MHKYHVLVKFWRSRVLVEYLHDSHSLLQWLAPMKFQSVEYFLKKQKQILRNSFCLLTTRGWQKKIYINLVIFFLFLKI